MKYDGQARVNKLKDELAQARTDFEMKVSHVYFFATLNKERNSSYLQLSRMVIYAAFNSISVISRAAL